MTPRPATRNARTLRIAVVSDMHAYVPDKEKPVSLSHLPIQGVGDPLQNPVESLKLLIAENELEVDLLLSPGDLGNQASPPGIAYAWSALHDLGDALRAKQVAAATGNHDIDSRGIYHKFDPMDCIKTLQPPFPLQAESEYLRYWSQHYALVEETDYRLVVLNTSAFHWLESERERGRVSTSTLSWLEQALNKRISHPSVNILLCHHHPHKHPELRVSDSSFDVMVDGNLLTDMLGAGNFGEWLIIHGHKHNPYLSYAAGTTQSPVILSAGSFSGHIDHSLGTRVRNQFYIVDIPLDAIPRMGLVGKIRSWTWVFQRGWIEPEGNDTGLPRECAFGCRANPVALASDVDNIVGMSPYVSWDVVLSSQPSIEFLLPTDFARLQAILDARYGIEILVERGRAVQAGRKCR